MEGNERNDQQIYKKLHQENINQNELQQIQSNQFKDKTIGLKQIISFKKSMKEIKIDLINEQNQIDSNSNIKNSKYNQELDRNFALELFQRNFQNFQKQQNLEFDETQKNEINNSQQKLQINDFAVLNLLKSEKQKQEIEVMYFFYTKNNQYQQNLQFQTLDYQQQQDKKIKQEKLELQLQYQFNQEIERDLTNVEKQKERLRIKQKLPIYEQKQQILQCIEENQVVILHGQTGCGKSTQIPKFIMEYYQRKDHGISYKDFKLVCTQPRRMAAINLAQRVSDELGTVLGKEVGYQIGMEKMCNQDTSILYMTNGVFLQKLIHDENFFANLTHIVLDEVHERDVDSDFALITIKHFLSENKVNSEIKIILMSATIQPQQFAKYFNKKSIQRMVIELKDKQKQQIQYQRLIYKEQQWGFIPKKINSQNQQQINQIVIDDEVFYDAPIIEINSKMKYEVKLRYLSDIIQHILKSQNDNFQNIQFDINNPELLPEIVQIGIDLINEIIKRNTELKQSNSNIKTSILVFLPGLNEIYAFKQLLLDKYNYISNVYQYEIIMLHSILSNQESKNLFIENKKITKIILSTNIAESSITIPDAAYIIDFCLQRVINFNDFGDLGRLDLVWVSQANADQRKGRTGRVCDGYCFRMISQQFFDHKMSKLPTPELQRCPLEKIVLRIKMLYEKEIENVQNKYYKNKYNEVEDAENILKMKINNIQKNSIFAVPQNILSQAMDPPQTDNITLAIQTLQDSGAITLQSDMKFSRITHIGQLYSDLPIDIRLAKMIIMGFSLNCAEEAITFVSLIAQQKSIFRIQLMNKNQLQYEFQSLNNLEYLLQKQEKHFENYFNFLYSHSYEQQCDLIIYFSIYNEWVSKFNHDQHLNLSLQNENIEYKHPNHHSLKFIRNKLYRFNKEEKFWCEDRGLDLRILREVYILKYELKQRLYTHGFNENYFTPSDISKKSIQKDDSYFLKLKILIISSFITNVFESVAIQSKTDKKIDQMYEMNLNPNQTIIATFSQQAIQSSQFLNKNELIRQLSLFGEVEKINYQYNEVFVQFSSSCNINKIIRQLIYKKMLFSLQGFQSKYQIHQELLQKFSPYQQQINNVQKKQCQSRTFEKAENKNDKQEKLQVTQKIEKFSNEMQNQGCYRCGELTHKSKDCNQNNIKTKSADEIFKQVLNIDYIPTFCFQDLLTRKEIIINQNSINRICLRKCTKYVAVDYQEIRNCKIHVKYVSEMPNLPLFVPIMMLIFYPQANINYREEKRLYNYQYYDRVTTDFGDISLDYFITKNMLEEINNIRKHLRENLSQLGFSIIPNNDIFQQIQTLLTKEKIIIFENEEWEILFYEKFGCEKKYYEYLLKKANENQLNIVKDVKIENIPKLAPKNTSTLNSIDFFYPSINFPNLQNILDVDSEFGLFLYQQKFEDYNLWKYKLLQQYNSFIDILIIKEAYLACNRDVLKNKKQCGLNVCNVKSVKGINYGIGLDLILSSYNIKKLQYNEKDQFCSKENMTFIQELLNACNGEKIELFGCQNEHILGFRITGNQKYDSMHNLWTILDDSTITLVYPNQKKEENFKLKDFNLENIMAKEIQALEQNKQKLNSVKFKNCFICGQQLIQTESKNFPKLYKQHMNQNKIHLEKLRVFKQSLIKLNFIDH